MTSAITAPANGVARRKELLRDLSVAALLLVSVMAIVCVRLQRFTWHAWATPIAYGGDGLFALAFFEAAGEGHYPLAPCAIFLATCVV